MKKQFTISEAEFQEMREIASTPFIKIGDYIPDPQERANEFWKRLAVKYGFVWDSVESARTSDPKDVIAEVAE